MCLLRNAPRGLDYSDDEHTDELLVPSLPDLMAHSRFREYAEDSRRCRAFVEACIPTFSLGRTCTPLDGSAPRNRVRGMWRAIRARKAVSLSSRSRRGPDRWRILVLVVIIPCFLCASAVKLARASSYRPQPIVCDGIDEDADAFVVYGLPDDTAKKLSLRSARDLPGRKFSCSAIIRPCVAQLENQRQAFPDSSLRSKRLPTQRTFRPDDPDGAH
jgi:hypothetical protein